VVDGVGVFASIVPELFGTRMSERKKEVAKGGKKCSCKKEVKEGEKAMMCEGCGIWFHLKCIGMSNEMYKAIGEEEGDEESETGLHWFCEGCNVGVKRMSERIKELEDRHKKMEIEVKKIAKDMEELIKREKESDEERKEDKEKQGKIEKEIGEVKSCIDEIKEKVAGKGEIEEVKNKIEEVRKSADEVKLSFAEVVGRGEREGVLEKPKEKESNKGLEKEEQMRMMEMIERAKRRGNLILFGIPEEGIDGEGTEIVQDVINGLLGVGKVGYEVVGRVGKKGDKPRPLRIKVEDSRSRRRILISAKNLKDMKGKENIYIVPDLTKMQQKEDREIREENRKKRLEHGAGRAVDEEKVIKDVAEGVNQEEETEK
jgi:hypothetical protein